MISGVNPTQCGLRGRARRTARLRPALLASTALIAGASLGLGASAAQAQSATWAGAGNDWDTGANWSPAARPTDTATFTGATPTSIIFSQTATPIGAMQFNAGAPGYTYTLAQANCGGCATNALSVTGTGIVNNSSNAPTFIDQIGGFINFQNSSAAGNAQIQMRLGTLNFQNTSNAGTAVITTPDAFHPGTINFLDQSAAANANITVVGSLGAGGGQLNFLDQSTAGNATITNNPGIGAGGRTTFGALSGTDTADAGTAHIVNNDMGVTSFLASTSAKTATITNNSGGSTSFQDQSTAANATIINNAGGATFFGVPLAGTDTATAGNANITNNAAGSTEFDAATTAGNATITNNAGGFLQFGTSGFYPTVIETASAGNSTITNSGTVTFNSATTAGNATITTNTGGNVFFFDASTGGTARFITNAGGTFDMSGLASGGMTAGSIEGAGTYLLGAKELAVGGNNLSTTVSGVIAGIGGSLDKVGTGMLTLAGVNTYTGATAIDGGVLEVNGSIASSVVTVNAGGILAGNGTVDPTTVTIASGGMFAPGTPGAPGTFMTIAGNLAFQSGAIYLVQLNPSSTTFATVTGTAALAGTVEAFFAPGTYVVPKSYDILQSSGLGGTKFSGVIASPVNFQANLTYTSTDVFLNLTAIMGAAGNLNVNQQNVATALNNFFNTGGTLPPSFAAVFGLTGPALANALTQLDGEASVDAQAAAFKSMDMFLALMLDPFVDGRSGSPGGGALGFAPDREAIFPPDIALAYDRVLKAPPAASAAFNDRWTAWGASYGGAANANGNPVIGSTDFTAQTFGFAGGLDRHFSPDLVAGFAFAGGGTHWGLAQGLGSGRSDAFQAGAYATKYFGPAYVAADVAFANNWFTTNRVALGDQLSASFNGQSYAGRVETGYRYMLPARWTIAPYAALQVQNFHTPRYSETDLTAGGFGLTYTAMSAYDTRSELGARFDEAITVYGMPVQLRSRLAWAHDWVDNPALQAVFQALPGANFIVNGAAVPKNSALTTAGAELHLTRAMSLLAKFDGEFAKGAQTYAGTGTLGYVW